MVHLAHVARLDDEPDLRAGLRADQVVVHGGAQQQRRDRRVLGVAVAVGQDDEPLALPDDGVDLVEDLGEPALEGRAAARDRVQARDPHAGEAGVVAVVVDVQDLRQLVVVDHRERQHDLAAVRRPPARAGCPPGR